MRTNKDIYFGAYCIYWYR